ncbi:LysE family translocator [Agromyces mariniharenae]|uniref:LysE family translocator n=1 Tax=Agromyces mariniharenae TaxID=2604423 RepID=A0A5S4V502_9MICO|nr:LysE family translocator [Agromyces mariniharenae]TYL52913.1 LysE family translocator [Agromyces mariniharenae]
MNLELLLACWGMMTLMVVVPGPDWAYIISAGMQERTLVPSLAGILVGYLAAVAAVAVGVGAAVAALPWVLVALTFSAATYLAYLGVKVLRHPPVVSGEASTASVEGAGAAAASDRPWLRLVQGAGVSGLNPKGLLVLVVLLPQFTDAASAWPIPVQLAVLGLIFVASCALVYSVVGVSARAVLRARPSAMRILSRVSGAAMVVLAVWLVAEQVSHFVTA